MFDPLRRGENASHDDGRGLGLGLYISREIARDHGGSIDASSDASGTVFKINHAEMQWCGVLHLTVAQELESTLDAIDRGVRVAVPVESISAPAAACCSFENESVRRRPFGR